MNSEVGRRAITSVLVLAAAAVLLELAYLAYLYLPDVVSGDDAREDADILAVSSPSQFASTSTPAPTHAPTSTPIPTCDATRSAEQVKRSVVRIQTPESLGTGVVVRAGGMILTNKHVVEGARTAAVTLADGRVVYGSISQLSPNQDLALLQTSAAGLTPIQWGSEATLRPATRLLAWGFARELPGAPSLTDGSFSGLRADSNTDYVQTNTQVNPGNSGGPLFTECGEVIGIVTFRLTNAEGLNFAIAASDARAFVDAAAPSSTPAAPSPEETVAFFYTLIDQRQFSLAWGLLSSGFQASQGTFETWQAGYATTDGVVVEFARRASGTGPAVEVSILARDIVSGRPLVRRFAGTWTLVQEQGVWRLDTGRIQLGPAP
jgi:S1-C subfamily serine protease